MSTEEEAIRELEEFQRETEKESIRFKGMIEGVKLGKLSSRDEDFVSLLEFSFRGFEVLLNMLVEVRKQQIRIDHTTSNLRTRMEKLETNILQLRETLDKLFEAR